MKGVTVFVEFWIATTAFFSFWAVVPQLVEDWRSPTLRGRALSDAMKGAGYVGLWVGAVLAVSWLIAGH